MSPFGLEGQPIVAQPLTMLQPAVPILVQAHCNAGLAYFLDRRPGRGPARGGP